MKKYKNLCVFWEYFGNIMGMFWERFGNEKAFIVQNISDLRGI
jgi:hypothetical protein